jgi:ribose 5-phosphate isomerase A
VDLEQIARQKDAVGRAAAELVEPDMLVGLGSGSTSARFVFHLAARRIPITAVPASPSIERLARDLGITVEPYAALPTLGHLDIAVDGADQVAPDGWIVKGGGGAHRRERVVASAADRFIVIVDSTKPVERIGPPIPLELAADRLASVRRSLEPEGLVTVRPDWRPSPDGGVIADFLGPVDDPAALAETLAATPGVLAHGLFPPSLIDSILIGRDEGVDRLH